MCTALSSFTAIQLESNRPQFVSISLNHNSAEISEREVKAVEFADYNQREEDKIYRNLVI